MIDLFKIRGRRRLNLVSAFLLFFLVQSIALGSDNPKLDRIGKTPQTGDGAAVPVVEYTAHNRGNIQLAVANNGTLGTLGGAISDPFTGEAIPSCIYPKGSDIVYLWVAAMWIGAVVGRDTLVSTANEDWYRTTEFWPDEKPFGEFRYKSIDINSPFYAEDARSEQDIICEYMDTLTNPAIVEIDPYDLRPHKPLNVKVTQTSMAWSYAYADDFILFDFQVENLSDELLEEVYMGFFVDGDVWHVSRNGPEGWNDDIVGFYQEHPAPEGCGFMDTINVAFTADNDGDPVGGLWDYRSALGSVGIRVVRTPAEELKYSYNWWIINYSDASQDFGPRRQGTYDDPFRYMGARMGTPTGDRNKYYVMSHEEFDYDLLYTALDHSRDGWLPPPEAAPVYAQGFDTRYLLSFGPFTINPGEKLPISFAWVAGANLHRNPTDFASLFDPQNPQPYYNALNFDSLAATSRWASWVYDNPGVDTDNNGYDGKFRVCVIDSTLGDDGWEPVLADTFYYEGDGVPDFSAAGPPPAPKVRIIPSESQLTIRWNGFYSENTVDIFSRVIDFEGYRLYVGEDESREMLSLIASYDREDYNRYIYTEIGGGEMGWALLETPFTLDSLRQLFGDPDFDPDEYSRVSPFSFGGEKYYFAPQDYNASDLLDSTKIHKAYPEYDKPTGDLSLLPEDELTYEHGEPLPKYYEYEYVLDGLLPTIGYHVSVTSFDFGSPVSGLAALETDKANDLIFEYPQTPADTVEAYGLDAYVYPNPYRIDDDYTGKGFENRGLTLPSDKARLLHFANLPRVCKISIFSIDGDLIAEIDHNYPQGGPESMHDTWDLITRNLQAVVSGLYYFVVESDTRTQIGKFVIIK